MAIQLTPELERIIQDAVDRQASDVFLIPGEPVSLRRRGCIERTDADPLTAEEVRAIAAAAVGQETVDKLGTTLGEARTSCFLPGVINGRLTVAKAAGDCTLVMSLAYPIILDIGRTGAPEALLEAVQAPSGLVVVAGVMGSGKSTTAVSLVDHINATRPVHICTVEDPVIAYLTPKQALIQQREVGTDVPDTVAGIRAALRQDLDVLYLCELKSVEEVQGALTAADTGHLVLAVAHGRSPEDVIQRFIDVAPPDMKRAFCRTLARTLRVVSVQCLLPKASGKGRVAAYGVLAPDDETRRAITEGADLANRGTPLPEGSFTLADGIRRLRDEGKVTAEAADAALAEL